MIGKSTMAFLTGQSWHLLKSWYTGLHTNKNKDNDQKSFSFICSTGSKILFMYMCRLKILNKYCKGLKEFLLAKDCKKKSKTERGTAVHVSKLMDDVLAYLLI